MKDQTLQHVLEILESHKQHIDRSQRNLILLNIHSCAWKVFDIMFLFEENFKQTKE